MLTMSPLLQKYNTISIENGISDKSFEKKILRVESVAVWIVRAVDRCSHVEL